MAQLLHQNTHYALDHHYLLHHLSFIHSSFFFLCSPSVKTQPHTVDHAGTLMCCDGEKKKNISEQKLKEKKIGCKMKMAA